MFVYRGNELHNRRNMATPLGFWVDYWLFLHSNDAYPIWVSRPLGVSSIVSTFLTIMDEEDSKAGSKLNRMLRKQMKTELNLAARLADHVPAIPTPPKYLLDEESDEIPRAWLVWCRDVAQLTSSEIASSLISSLARSLDLSEWSTAAYLSRRLGAELGGDEWTREQLFSSIKTEFVASNHHVEERFDRSSFATKVQDLLVAKRPRNYTVRIRVAPVLLAATARKYASFIAPVKMVTERTESDRYELVALETPIVAVHHHLAAMKALYRVRDVLDTLRLRHYVITHPYGKCMVEDDASRESWNFPLPQPFWPAEWGRRDIPVFPPRFTLILKNLEVEESERWLAARWHLSEAFSDWSEDAHTAAAKVWQALESFAPAGSSAPIRVNNLRQTYITRMCEQGVAFIAKLFTMQRNILAVEYKSRGRDVDWYYLNEQTTPGEWARRVLDRKSYNHYSSWKSPQAPKVLFEPNVGILEPLLLERNAPGSIPWIGKRINSDLALLFGLRNRVVHAGKRTFSPRMADYLGQFGSEMLFLVMADKAARLLSP